MRQVTEQQFDDMFDLVDNPFEERGYSNKMFETFGEELEMVIEAAKENRVITIIEAEEGMLYATGMYIVNRVGFFITEEPIQENVEFYDKLEMP